MSTKFLRNGKTFQVVDSESLNQYDTLPGGNYVIRQSPDGVLYLERVESFKAPPKMYGDTIKQADRILNTFHARPSGTGVLLSGEKGSGKTLLCRTVCMEAEKQDIPTIIINQPWKGDSFFAFITAITQPCIVMFDEFEKVYREDEEKHDQNAILTLLDGVFLTKKLFLLTCNDPFGINRNMLNRPGRVFYALEFEGLDEGFIHEYCMDSLRDKSHTESVVTATRLFANFNFDMLKALVEEMNRYSEPAAESLKMLNVSPTRDYSRYKINVLLASREEVVGYNPTTIENPLGQRGGIQAYVYYNKRIDVPDHPHGDGDAEDYEITVEGGGDVKPVPPTFRRERRTLIWQRTDMISSSQDKLIFRNADGDILNLIRERLDSRWDWEKETAKAL